MLIIKKLQIESKSNGAFLTESSEQKSEVEGSIKSTRRTRRTRFWFHAAIVSRNIDLLKQKIRLNDFYLRDHQSQTILHLVAKTGDVNVMTFLLNKLNYFLEQQKEESAHWEAKRAKEEPVSPNCPRVINPLNDIDCKGNSALDIAIKRGFLNVVVTLKKAGGIAFKQQSERVIVSSPISSPFSQKARNKLFKRLNQFISQPKSAELSAAPLKQLEGLDIQHILEHLFGDSVHIVYPDISTAQTLWSGQTEKCPMEGYVKYAEILLGYVMTDGKHSASGLFKPGKPLDKPIIMILNTDGKVGSHWICCVILPPNYHALHSVSENNCTQFFLIDSLGHEQYFPEGFKKLLIHGGEVMTTPELGERESAPSDENTPDLPVTTNLIQGQFREDEVQFHDAPPIIQQKDGWSCGYWAIYNAFMLFHTNTNKFLEQFISKDPISQEQFAKAFILYFNSLLSPSPSAPLNETTKEKSADIKPKASSASKSSQLVRATLFGQSNPLPKLNKIAWRDQLRWMKDYIQAIPLDFALQRLAVLENDFNKEAENAIEALAKNPQQQEIEKNPQHVQVSYWTTLQNDMDLGAALVLSRLGKLLEEMLEASQPYYKDWEYQVEIAMEKVVAYIHYYQQVLPKSFEKAEVKGLLRGLLQLQNKASNYNPVSFFTHTLQKKLSAYWRVATLLKTGMIEEREEWSHLFHLIRSPFFILPVAGGAASAASHVVPEIFEFLFKGVEITFDGFIILLIHADHFLKVPFGKKLEELLLRGKYLSAETQKENLIHSFNCLLECEEQTMGIATTLGHRYANVLTELTKEDALLFAEFNARLCLDYFKTGLYRGREESSNHYDGITAWVSYESSFHESEKWLQWLQTKITYKNKTYPIHELISKTGCYVSYIDDNQQKRIHCFDLTTLKSKTEKTKNVTDGNTMGYCAASGLEVRGYIRHLESLVHPEMLPKEESKERPFFPYEYQDDGTLAEKCKADLQILNKLRPVHSNWVAPSERLEEVEYRVEELKRRLNEIEETDPLPKINEGLLEEMFAKQKKDFDQKLDDQDKKIRGLEIKLDDANCTIEQLRKKINDNKLPNAELENSKDAVEENLNHNQASSTPSTQESIIGVALNPNSSFYYCPQIQPTGANHGINHIDSDTIGKNNPN